MDILNFCITLCLGFMIILFYFLYLPKNNYVWGDITDKNERQYIMLSILLACISYLFIWIKQVFFRPTEKFLILYTIGNSLFLIGGILWPLFLNYFPTHYHLVIFSLCITSLGALIILIQQSLEKDIIGIIFSIYLFFHVFFMDNVLWASSYRSLFPIKNND